MMQRRTFLSGAAAMGAAAGLGLLAGCASTGSAANRLNLWGVGGDQRPVEQKILKAYQKVTPGVQVTSSTVPSNGTGDATSIITAVRGHTAPDLWVMDAFSCAQYASLGLLESISGLIEQEEKNYLQQWLQFPVDSLTLNGQVYGLPLGTDSRALFYNKKVLRDAGIDPDELDPKNGPPTAARIMEMSRTVTKKDSHGNYTQLGLIPWDGEGWAYTWAIGYGARFFDDASCAVEFQSKEMLAAYTFLYEQAREMDYSKVDAFKATYEPPNHPPAQTSFLSGHQAFMINQNGFAVGMKKYAPKLDWGVTYLPLPHENAKPYTWSGGFALVAPKGAKLTKELWDFQKFYSGKPGQSIFMGPTQSLPTQLDVLHSKDPQITSQKFFIDQLKFSVSRPPIPVGQLWWDAMATAQGSVTIGSAKPAEALEAAQARVQPQMDLYCPFTLPRGYGA